MRLQNVNQNLVRFGISFLPERIYFCPNSDQHLFSPPRDQNVIEQSGVGNEEIHQGTTGLMYIQILKL